MLKIAFIHPDLGIGGAERLVVDAALGLQDFGHEVDIYTSHHDPNHCFEETKDGRLKVHNVVPPFPRAINGKFHILLAHLRQLHLTTYLLSPGAPRYDVFFVDQLSTCIPLLRSIGHARVVFYCHFPDKLLANGEFIEDPVVRAERNLLKGGLLKRIYRYPMDWLEEFTTRQADVILANSKFTGRVFKDHFPSIQQIPEVVYPGINIAAYEATEDSITDSDVAAILSDQPTLISLNRFEKKKNVALAVEAFARIRTQEPSASNLRLVLGGGYDPRLEDNMLTLYSLIDLVSKKHTLTYNVITPSSSPKAVKIPPLNTTPENPVVLFLLNFTTAQRTALLTSPSTIGLLYTPANEHFGIVPVEGMLCGVPVLACDSGGPVESIVDKPADERTGWLRAPDPEIWTEALREIVGMGYEERVQMRVRAKKRARELFGMEAMARGIEDALKEAVSMEKVRSRLMFWLLVTLGIVGLVLALMWV
ncbi:MAG: alpha-1,3-mannosyltransferase ALG2 [Lentinula lateritia]|uniref:Alpha-1,3/1,6-mannosyltransferase ALG2 n=1 Tax=Lentinula lateritia TaxID=40482 RepID=A0ABQ8V2S1_9AGAR|nr:MAG: alpha-1,3-mannosyltransferase ALG2 [Lentinula lateritia]KAJ4465602.1 mannosyltransferase [Lentinula lateritia]